MTVRFAQPADSSALLAIYAQYIATPITFEYALPTEAEFADRIAHIARDYPYLVCEENGQIIGYAHAHRHMEREAYQWNAELSVYLDQEFTLRGLGKRLYHILMEMLKLQGIRTVYGGVTLPNTGSEALHGAMGFQVLGTYRKAGFKAGQWHDVAWFEKAIAPHDDNPQPITAVRHIPREQLQRIISSAS